MRRCYNIQRRYQSPTTLEEQLLAVLILHKNLRLPGPWMWNGYVSSDNSSHWFYTTGEVTQGGLSCEKWKGNKIVSDTLEMFQLSITDPLFLINNSQRKSEDSNRTNALKYVNLLSLKVTRFKRAKILCVFTWRHGSIFVSQTSPVGLESLLM